MANALMWTNGYTDDGGQGEKPGQRKTMFTFSYHIVYQEKNERKLVTILQSTSKVHLLNYYIHWMGFENYTRLQ